MKKFVSLFLAGLFLLGAGPCAAPSTETPAAGSGPSNINTTETGGSSGTGATGGGTDDGATIDGTENPARTGGVEAGNPSALTISGQFKTSKTPEGGEACPVDQVILTHSDLVHDAVTVGSNCSFEKEYPEGPKDLAIVAVAEESQWSIVDLGNSQDFSTFPAGSTTNLGMEMRFDAGQPILPTIPQALAGKEVDLRSVFGIYSPGVVRNRSRSGIPFCSTHPESVRIELRLPDAGTSPGGPEDGVQIIISSAERRDLFRGTMKAGFLRGSSFLNLDRTSYYTECRGDVSLREETTPPTLRMNLTCYYSPQTPERTKEGACYYWGFTKP